MERQTQREVETETETWWVSQVGDDRKSSYTEMTVPGAADSLLIMCL